MTMVSGVVQRGERREPVESYTMRIGNIATTANSLSNTCLTHHHRLRIVRLYCGSFFRRTILEKLALLLALFKLIDPTPKTMSCFNPCTKAAEAAQRGAHIAQGAASVEQISDSKIHAGNHKHQPKCSLPPTTLRHRRQLSICRPLADACIPQQLPQHHEFPR